MDPYSTIHLLVSVLLILFNAFFSMSEIAIITLNDSKLKNMAAQGNKKAKKILALTNEPTRFLATMRTWTTFISLLLSAYLANQMAEKSTAFYLSAFPDLGLSSSVCYAVILLLTVIVLTFVILLLGQLVPQRIAMEHAESVAFALIPLLSVFALLIRPFVALLSFCTRIIVRLFGIRDAAKPENVTEEEIRMMVDVGNETGVIEESEKDMINNIFEFDDKTASEVMTHRTDLVALEENTTVMNAIQTFVESGHSRLPVYTEDIDTICGFLYAKDLLKLAGNSFDMENIIKVYIRPAMYIPESTRCADLMKVFKENKIQIAMVVDEYGGTSGVVTMEDLLETIVGNIQDEYDDEEAESAQISDNCYTLDGSLSLDEVERILKIQFSEDEDGEEYDTLSGMLTNLLDRIPSAWEHPSITVDGVTFTVLEMDDRFMAKIKAEILPQELPEE